MQGRHDFIWNDLSAVRSDDNKARIGLRLSKVASRRLKHLLERTDWLAGWRPIEYLTGLLHPKPPEYSMNSQEFDATIAIWQLLTGTDELDDSVYDSILDVTFEKVRRKGGVNCELANVPDIFYEGQIRRVLAAFSFPGITFDAREQNRPDLVFAMRWYEAEQESNLAIECKNIRAFQRDLRNWIRTTADAIKKAANQHSARSADFSDVVIFVDLPIEAFLSPTESRLYERLIVNVWNQLKLEGWSEIDESHVVFTATSQENMIDYLKRGNEKPINLTIMRPLVVGKDEIPVKGHHAILLSWLFREQDQSVNLMNWSRVALRIDDWKDLLLD